MISSSNYVDLKTSEVENSTISTGSTEINRSRNEGSNVTKILKNDQYDPFFHMKTRQRLTQSQRNSSNVGQWHDDSSCFVNYILLFLAIFFAIFILVVVIGLLFS